jgi:hypothetical protein
MYCVPQGLDKYDELHTTFWAALRPVAEISTVARELAKLA